MSREMTLWDMQHEKGELQCTDEKYSYFSLWIDGRELLYRKRTLRPDGRKSFMLTDEFARALGFDDLMHMGHKLTGIQYWRGFISVERLRIALKRFKYKWDGYKW